MAWSSPDGGGWRGRREATRGSLHPLWSAEAGPVWTCSGHECWPSCPVPQRSRVACRAGAGTTHPGASSDGETGMDPSQNQRCARYCPPRDSVVTPSQPRTWRSHPTADSGLNPKTGLPTSPHDANRSMWPALLTPNHPEGEALRCRSGGSRGLSPALPALCRDRDPGVPVVAQW